MLPKWLMFNVLIAVAFAVAGVLTNNEVAVVAAASLLIGMFGGFIEGMNFNEKLHTELKGDSNDL